MFIILFVMHHCLILQSDLIEDDIMILDAWECIYIWQGKNSNKIEREDAQRCAIVSGS